METIKLTKHIFGDLVLNNLLGVFEPQQTARNWLTDEQLLEKIVNPIGTPGLRHLAKDCKNVLIVTDDNTRKTPLHRIVPLIIKEIESAGVKSNNITILIGLGTHRAMSETEIREKFGEQLFKSYRIINHEWNNSEKLCSIGTFELGFEVIINKLILNTDLVVSVGNIVPHATAGYSGGGKTIMPGICGNTTIADTHWAALKYEMREILGNADNDVRESILSVCKKVGLHMIVNAVLLHDGQIYDLVAGDMDLAHRAGIEASKDVYGVYVDNKADIVIAEAFPTDIDLRQAIKAICSADLICNEGGVIILPAECPEGVAPQFPDFQKYGFRDPDNLFDLVESGKFKQKLLAYTLVAIGRIITKRVKSILVSPNVSKSAAEKMGFYWAADLQTAYDMAKEMTHADASTIVLKQAGEILPLHNKKQI